MEAQDKKKVADLKDKIAAEIGRIPKCVRLGGVMRVKEWKYRVELATKLMSKAAPKIQDLDNALFLLQTIDKYEPRAVSLNERGRAR